MMPVPPKTNYIYQQAVLAAVLMAVLAPWRAAEAQDTAELYRQEDLDDDDTIELTIELDERPSEAGIDPRNLLIDRQPSDNRKTIP